MAQWINCGNCDFTLYWGEPIKHRYIMRYPEEAWLANYNNECPNCGAALSMESVKITFDE